MAKNAGLYFKEESLLRLKNHNPEIKLIFVLRDPVERTYSAYNMEVNYASLTEPFDHICEVVDNENPEDWKFDLLIGMSLYTLHLAKVYSIFPPSQVMIIRYEELKNDALSVCKRIFGWAHLDPSFSPNISRRFNVTVMNRSPFYGKVVKKLLNNSNPLKSIVRKMMPSGLDHRVGEKLRDINKSGRSFERISVETEKYLREYFKPYNNKLSEMTGIDFSGWNQMSPREE